MALLNPVLAFLRRDEEDCFSFDLNLYTEIKYMMSTNPTIDHCLKTFDYFLFSEIKIDGASKLLSDYIEFYWIPFFREVLRNIYAFGWVAYRIRRINPRDPTYDAEEDNDDMIYIPEVVPWEYINAEMVFNKKTFKFQMNFYDPLKQYKRTNIKYVFFEDINNLRNPTLIYSALKGMIPDFRMLETIRKFTIQAEYTRSNPPIYLKAQTTGMNKLTGTVLHAGDGAPAAQPAREQDAVFSYREQQTSTTLAERASENMSDNIEFHQQQMMELNHDMSQNFYNVGLFFRPQWYKNQFICPPGSELACNPVLPVSREDQLTSAMAFSSFVYIRLGLPESIFGSSLNSFRGNSNTSGDKVRQQPSIIDITLFDATMSRLEEFFCQLLCKTYSEVFPKTLERRNVHFISPKVYNSFIDNIKKKMDLEIRQLELGVETAEINNKATEANIKASEANVVATLATANATNVSARAEAKTKVKPKKTKSK